MSAQVGIYQQMTQSKFKPFADRPKANLMVDRPTDFTSTQTTPHVQPHPQRKSRHQQQRIRII
ncbi:MAG: hypothetical protein HC860_27235 [Alkalinema sp. RU_4_3]|nr:hypothetical protein [Alkalinema sp. RU_4_3]